LIDHSPSEDLAIVFGGVRDDDADDADRELDNVNESTTIPCYDASVNPTPNLDRIATDGMRFDYCCVTNSTCTPSQASIRPGHKPREKHPDPRLNTLHTPPEHSQTPQDWRLPKRRDRKWRLGEGPASQPSSFDYWRVLPGQGEYFDAVFISIDTGGKGEADKGYTTNIIMDKSIPWMKSQDKSKHFFLMCHRKVPHRMTGNS
jgi:hypothetical protein